LFSKQHETATAREKSTRHQQPNADASYKAQQDKERRDAAIANAIGIRTISAIAAVVPVRLMKRDLLFVAERLASLQTKTACPSFGLIPRSIPICACRGR